MENFPPILIRNPKIRTKKEKNFWDQKANTGTRAWFVLRFFLIKTRKFWVEAGYSLLFMSFQSHLWLKFIE